jgi:type IX secretion system PorP/SprF family membrane protein
MVEAFKKSFILILFIFSFSLADGQQTPLDPMSYWVFIPYVYNPAMAGSKDYLSVDINTSFMGKSNTQILSASTRLTKTMSGYFSSPDLFQFRDIGLGGSIFHDVNGSSSNVGLSMAGSYQIPMNTKKISYLSFGASLKAVYNTLDKSADGSGTPSKSTFYPNFDLGAYYYGENLYTGLSVVNILGNPGGRDSLGVYEIPAARQFFFTAGYKIVINRDMNIVVEPSVLVNSYDSTFSSVGRRINPILRFYVGNFCAGTYFLEKGKTSFFAQFRYPRFYLGTFFDIPRKKAFFKNTPIVQFTAGLNISKDKSRLSKKSHW